MEMNKSPPPQYSESEGIAQGPGVYSAQPAMIVAPTVQQVHIGQAVGPNPANLVCPSCRANIISRIDNKSTTKTHVIALLLCIFACWPCVFMPYCMDSCKNADHFCPNCNAFIGTYKR